MNRLFCASARLCVCAAFLSCTDPRGRPVPPVVQISFSPTFQLTSPGQLLGSLYLFDTDGIFTLDLSVLSADSTLSRDSSLVLTGDVQITRELNFVVPAGIPIGTNVRVVARAQDLAGFSTSDTLNLVVQDTVASLR